MNISIRIKRRSLFISAVVPTLFFFIIFFSVWIGIPHYLVFFMNYENTTVMDFLVGLGWIPATIVGFALSVVLYRPYLKLSDKFIKAKTLTLNLIDKTIRYGNKKIDLSLPYYAKILYDFSRKKISEEGYQSMMKKFKDSGEPEKEIITPKNKTYSSCSTIEISQGRVHMSMTMTIYEKDLFNYFPFFDSNFFNIKHTYSGDFDLDWEVENQNKFFTSLLKTLWETRDKNELFAIYQKFPWGHQPKPNYKIIVVDYNNHNDKEFIEEIKKNIISSPVESISLSPDYVILNYYKKILLLPIGLVIAKVSSHDKTNYINFNFNFNFNLIKSTDNNLFKVLESFDDLTYRWIQNYETEKIKDEAYFFVKYINSKLLKS